MTTWRGGFGGALCALTCVVSACGGSPATTADAGVIADATPDAIATIPSDASYPACHEFATQAMPVPVQTTGNVSSAGADILSPSSCTVVNAPYGIESSGVDQVVRVDALTIGTDYTVVLDSNADLAFYVVTGCDTPSGPSADECLLFEDETSGHVEHGIFTAPATSVWIVVDDYRTEPPTDGTFSLAVTAVQCHQSADCSGATPACSNEGQCVACVTSFDCTSPSTSVCDPHSNTCIEGPGGCSLDDATENADDGPAGALVTTPDADSSSIIDGHLCNASDAEHDYVRFDVAVAGEDWSADLEWLGSQDLDLTITDSAGNDVGVSLYAQPEHIDLTYLPVGSYFIRIDDFSPSNTSAVPYQLTVTRSSTSGCSTSADCATEFANQLYRGACTAGACEAINGGGALEVGEPCDSIDDCASGEQCPAFFFAANADTRSVCAPNCVTDNDCAAAGSDYVCTTYLDANLCVQKCTNDDQCPRIPDVAPTTPPWAFLTCDLPTGQCLP